MSDPYLALCLYPAQNLAPFGRLCPFDRLDPVRSSAADRHHGVRRLVPRHAHAHEARCSLPCQTYRGATYRHHHPSQSGLHRRVRRHQKSHHEIHLRFALLCLVRCDSTHRRLTFRSRCMSLSCWATSQSACLRAGAGVPCLWRPSRSRRRGHALWARRRHPARRAPADPYWRQTRCHSFSSRWPWRLRRCAAWMDTGELQVWF